jgi:hypothetical protein
VQTEAELRLNREHGECMSAALRRTIVDGTYERANSLTVVKCALEAVMKSTRMDEDSRRRFLEMALTRTDELIDRLEQDVKALELA